MSRFGADLGPRASCGETAKGAGRIGEAVVFLGAMQHPLSGGVINAELSPIMAKIAPIHPGEHLLEILDELEITPYRLARTIGVPVRRVNEIVHGKRSITADTALRIGRALRTTPEFWLNLQRRYDLDVARDTIDVSTIEPLVPEMDPPAAG